MYKVRKRDGKIVSFDINKISDAIIKAFEGLEKEYDNHNSYELQQYLQDRFHLTNN